MCPSLTHILQEQIPVLMHTSNRSIVVRYVLQFKEFYKYFTGTDNVKCTLDQLIVVFLRLLLPVF